MLFQADLKKKCIIPVGIGGSMEMGGCFRNRSGKFKVFAGDSFSELWHFISNLCNASEVQMCAASDCWTPQ